MNERERRRIIDNYLGDLSDELSDVPRGARRDLLEDIRSHIEEAWAASPGKERADLMAILNRLGSPQALADEQRERLGLDVAPTPRGPDVLSVLAVILTVLFWPIGLLLAWISDRWDTRDKLIATALPLVGVVLVVLTSAVAYTTIGSASVVQTGPLDQVGPMTQPAPLPHENVASAIAGRFLALYGFFGAPFTAAIYLAFRIRSARHRLAVLIPVVGVILVLGALLTVFLVPTPGNPTLSGSRPATSVIERTVPAAPQ